MRRTKRDRIIKELIDEALIEKQSEVIDHLHEQIKSQENIIRIQDRLIATLKVRLAIEGLD